MPWRKVEMSEERLRFAIRATATGANVTALCGEYGVSRQTGYNVLKRYREGGAKAVLEERSRRPHQSPRRTPAETVAAIKQLRQATPDWGARKLLKLLEKEQAAASRVSITTLNRILKREGLIAGQDERRTALQRFERSAPNELWQMDFKGPQGFNKGTGPLSIQDDFSRYLLALQHLGNQRAANVQTTLRATFEECGLPDYLLIDHGTPWYNTWNPWGWTELTVWILRQGVQIILSGVRHPQTQGKVERMHEALQRAIRKRHANADQQDWLDEFRQQYNHVRPHEGIGMAVPASRWQPSPRPFQPQPPEWTYPKGWEDHRLSGEGRLNWLGQCWPISGALRNQHVGLERTGDRVLVHFCNLTLCEIHLLSGRSVTLPANPFRHLHG